MKLKAKSHTITEEALRARLTSVSAGFVAWLLDITPSEVSQLVAVGMPRRSEGTYDWHVISRWLKREGRTSLKRLPGAANGPGTSTSSASTPTDDRATLDRYKALTARAEYEERIGKLIARDEAMRAQMRLALEFKASLLALPEQLAMALANLPAREVEAALRERVEWILGRAQDGTVPIPAKLVEAIAQLVLEHLPRAPAEVNAS